MKRVLLSFVLLLGVLMAPAVAHAQGIYGDVNGDLEVTIADINAVIDILLDGTGYSAAADVNRDGEVSIADVNVVIDIILNPAVVEEHEYVDLGLPSGTLWATCNIGASVPEGYGDYFAWGETAPKDYYDWDNYMWCDGTRNTLTKYCTNSYYGTVDGKTELDSEDDAATANWGSAWRMPTLEQLQELEEYCDWQWKEMNGVYGRLAIGPNGNSIFLPASGGYSDHLYYNGICAYYWSSTLCTRDKLIIEAAQQSQAYILFVDSWHEEIWYNSRYDGLSVRAVRSLPADDSRLYIVQQSLDLGAMCIDETHKGELTIVNYTSEDQTLAISVDEPFSLKQEEGSASTMTVVVPANTTYQVTVMLTATEVGEFNGNVTFLNPLLDGGQSVIPVKAKVFSGHEYVDLGLPSGTLWATCNIGATSPEGYGDYFAWGETEPKNAYTWYNYKWCDGGSYSITKYCTKSEYGTVDGKTELDPEDDAASVNWGPSWCMPTETQRNELSQECTWQWTQMNGVNGFLVTGRNGNTLFLPAGGYCNDYSSSGKGYFGYYWTRTLSSSNSSGAYTMYLYQDDWDTWVSFSRNRGHSVRAVRVETNIPELYIEQHILDMGWMTIGNTCTGILTIVNNSNESKTVAATADAPFAFKQGNGSASSITVVVPGNSRVMVTVMFAATSLGEFSGNVTFQSPAFDGGQNVVQAFARTISSDYIEQGYVDLGLPSGLLWATTNVGASSPEEYGDYFAWGETEPKEIYSWETYKWCNGSDHMLTKYCTESEYGTVDGKTVLDPEDDAASVNLGSLWRMPTNSQFSELRVKCNWNRTTINGVKCHVVTGPNGNKLFLPYAGQRKDGSLTLEGIVGDYLTCELYPNSGPNIACGSECNSSGWVGTFGTYRCHGCVVRAVRLP